MTAHLCSIERLEPRIAPAGDLVVQNIAFSFGDPDEPTIGGPSQIGKVTFTLKNIHPTDTATTGGAKTGFHVYFSADAVFNGEATDMLVGRKPNQSFTLGPGEEKVFKNVPVALPDLDLPVPKYAPGDYFLLVQADSGNRVAESNKANNITASAQKVHYTFEFGNVGSRTNVSLLAFDADSVAKFSLKGEGTGELKFDPALGLPGNFAMLEVGGTDGKSVLQVKASGGDKRVDVGSIMADAPLKIASLIGVNVARDATFGEVPKVVLGDVGFAALAVPAVQQTLTFNGTNPTALAMDRVADVHVSAPGGIASLFATEWIEFITGGANDDVVTSAFLGSFTVGGSRSEGIAGHSEVGLFLDGADAKGMTLGKTKINGEIRDAFWQVRDSGDATRGHAGDILAAGADGWNLAVQGGAGNVTIKGDLIGGAGLPALAAMYFGKINVSDDLEGDIVAAGESPKGFAIVRLGADSVRDTVVLALEAGIGDIKVEEWHGGRIETLWLKRLITSGNDDGAAGDFEAALLLRGPEFFVDAKGRTVADAPKGVKGSLGKAQIAGEIEASTWSAFSHIDTIKAGSIAPGFILFGSDLNGFEGTKVKQVMVAGDLSGFLRAAEIGRVEAKGVVSASILTTNPDPAAQLVLFGGQYIGASVKTNHQVWAKIVGWGQGDIEANTIDQFWATGNTKAGIAGDIQNAVIDTAGKDARGVSIGAVRAEGAFTDVTIDAPADSHIFLITAAQWVGGSVEAGSVGDLNQRARDGVLENVDIMLHGIRNGSSLDLFSAQGTVRNSHFTLANGADTFIARGMTDSTVDATGADITWFTSTSSPDGFFQFSHVTARTILRLDVRNVNPSATGTDYGFTADFVGNYKRYEGRTEVQSLSGLDTPGEADRTGDFRLLIS